MSSLFWTLVIVGGIFVLGPFAIIAILIGLIPAGIVWLISKSS